MKYVAKIGRHYTSYQVVLPKRLIKELGWQFQDFVVITLIDGHSMKIETLDHWASTDIAKTSTLKRKVSNENS